MSLNAKIFLLLCVPALGVGIYFLLKALKKRKIRQRVREEEFTEEENEYLSKNFKPYVFLTKEERIRLKNKTLYFLETKIFFTPDDFSLTANMKLLIAIQACLLLTNTQEEVYPELSSIFVFQDAYVPKDNPVNPFTGLPTHAVNLGESWHHGPLVVSWEAVASSSVVYHEFAHKLDGEDGSFDGTPRLEFALKKDQVYKTWAEAMGRSFLSLREKVVNHRRTDIDAYGATNEAEFFAVITEYYITNATQFKDKHPTLYDQLNNYFRLDPIRWS